ncbi:hypothetical protein [Neobacillus drentensis]|uniref:hypothetical protein n=1 Tax=Neobacillus drentensis TaxID=220684 RepID=UPI002FFDCA14
MADSGVNSFKGFKAQTFITLLEALEKQNWNNWLEFTLEPNFSEEIVDIHFKYSDEEWHYQVKSSKNPFKEGSSIKILYELRDKAENGTEDKVRLVLVGECDFEHPEIIVRPLNFQSMKCELSNLLGKYVEAEFLWSFSEESLSVLTSALITDTEILTIEDRITFDREKFKQVISNIINYLIRENEIDLSKFKNIQQLRGWLNQLVANYNINTPFTNAVEQIHIIDNSDFKLDNAYRAMEEVAKDTILWKKFYEVYLQLKRLNNHLNTTIPLVRKAIESNNQGLIDKLECEHQKFISSNKLELSKVEKFKDWLNQKFGS